jgi:hypothetical protein
LCVYDFVHFQLNAYAYAYARHPPTSSTACCEEVMLTTRRMTGDTAVWGDAGEMLSVWP